MWNARRIYRLALSGRLCHCIFPCYFSVWTKSCLIVTVVMLGSSRSTAESMSTLIRSTATPVPFITAIANADDVHNGGGNDEQVTAYIEELFLGKIVYPQEADEVQLTGESFHGGESPHDSSFAFEVEYGVTDQLQIGADATTQFARGETFQDLQQCSIEVYYNFYSERRTGRAYGLGFEFGLPVDSTDDEPRACVYEPFFVAYQEFQTVALNLSTALEIADPVARGEATEVAGDLTLAIFRRVDRIATILEANVEVDSEESPVRLAPGLYWRPFDVALDVAVSLPFA